MFLRANRLCRTRRFTPTEAYRLGLFLPGASRDGHCDYISRKELTKIQKRLNPESRAALVRDKGAFYRFCLTADVPAPALYAVFLGPAPGWRPDGRALTGRKEWLEFMDNELPHEFVIKPTVGAYGRGVKVLARNGAGFFDNAGQTMRAEQLHDAMGDDEFAGFVIQQRVRNAPELLRLTGTEALQTVRMITFLDVDAGCRILHGNFKPILGDHVADNSIDGLTGNVEAPVDLADGVLGPANQIMGTGEGIRTIRQHPATGAVFEGFRLPMWQQACRLVRATAPKFLPLRTIGWDVALTPTGPMIIEGNVWWDAPNQHASIGPLIRALSADVS
jgi:hypothetical protein